MLNKRIHLIAVRIMTLSSILLAAVLSPSLTAAPKLPEAEAHRHGTEATVDLGVGLWGIPLPVDYDGDLDLLIVTPLQASVPNLLLSGEGGKYFFFDRSELTELTLW